MATNVDWTDEAADGIDDLSGDRMAFAAWVDETPDPAAAQEVPMEGMDELGESFDNDLGDTLVEKDAAQSLDALEDVFVDALNSKDAGEYFGHVLHGLRRVPGAASRPGTPTADLLPRFMALLQRYRAQRFDEMEALEDLADQFADDGSDEAASLVGGLLARALARPPARRPSRPLNRPLRQQLVRNTRQAARTLVRRQGPHAVRALPAVVRSIQRTATRRRLPARALPSAVRNIATRVARAPTLVRQITRSRPLLRPRSPAFLQPGQTFVRTIYGWGQYKRRVEDLPPDQQAVLKGIGNSIIASHKPGGQPVRTVTVYGHADLDTPPNRQREQRYSEERAQMVTNWLTRYVGSAIAAQIIWDTQGFGATELKEKERGTEASRRRNRRVDIFVQSAINRDSACPPIPTSNSSFTGWLQTSLNQVLGTRLHADGIFGTQTRNALRSFQERRGLPRTGQVDWATFNTLQNTTRQRSPCTVFNSDGDKVAQALVASQATLRIALSALKSLETGAISGLLVPEFYKQTLNAVRDRLKVTPKHDAFLVSIQRAQQLIRRNLEYQSKYKHLVRRDEPFCQTHGETWAWSYVNNPLQGIRLCKSWFDACAECQRDVITHEFFHLIGLQDMVDEKGKRANTKTDRSLLTPSESLQDANEMAQLVSHIVTGSTDACWKFQHGKACGQPITP